MSIKMCMCCHSNNTRGRAEVSVCGSLNFPKKKPNKHVIDILDAAESGMFVCERHKESYQTSQVDYTCVLASWTSLEKLESIFT